MGNQIELLIRLQTVDQQLRERTETIESLKATVAAIQNELDERRAALESCRAERAELEARRRDIEAVLADEESKMKDRRMRLNRIRNEKEAAAVRREIEVGKEGNQKHEEDLLILFEALDGVNARESEIKTVFDELEARRTAAQEKADAEIAELSAGLDEARGERETLAAGLEAAVRSLYEGIFVRKRGLAVVEVRSGSCEGCHMRVAPQMVNELQRSQRIISCPSCHRILFWRPEPAVREEA